MEIARSLRDLTANFLVIPLFRTEGHVACSVLSVRAVMLLTFLTRVHFAMYRSEHETLPRGGLLIKEIYM
jgi:hypothetical protein